LILDRGFFGLRIVIVGDVMYLRRIYSIQVCQVPFRVLARQSAFLMESVSSKSNNFVDSGAVICKGFSDVVQFGTITMDNFTFGSCYGEQDQFYPER
jgi:hypothetical protein